MSRCYHMNIEISEFRADRSDAIKAAAEEAWPFADWFEHEGTLTASADDNLCGGKSEEEFTERLSSGVWKANGEFCEVTVNATYMEGLPYEVHCRDQDDYERLLKTAPSAKSEPT